MTLSHAATVPLPSKKMRRTGKPSIGLALAGGGPLGAVYEIGALAALEESIDGLDMNDIDIYVGISAGGIIAAGLANGITPHQMCRLFIESESADLGIAEFKPEHLLKPAWAEFRKRAWSLPGLLGGSLINHVRRDRSASLASSFERLKEMLPTGLFSSHGIDDFLAQTFAANGRTNDFRKLANKLVIVATDLDSGQSVEFGQPGMDDVPISTAAQASASVPGLFSPVEIDGQFYVDGALRKTLHASIALKEGVDLLLCLNPIIPFNAKAMHAPGKLTQRGMLDVLSQTLRAIIHSRVELGMANYLHTYPDADILLFEPSALDAEMFFTNLFSYNTRRRMCENAYQHVRMTLWQRRVEIDAKLARHGLKLKRAVLRDTSLKLVKNARSGKEDRFGTRHLNETLDLLERHLKIRQS